MSRRRRALRAWSAVAVAALLAALAVAGTVAAFSDATDNAANLVSAAPDFTAPQISSAVVAKTPGYDDSFVKQGGSYHVYANVAADTGNPASGIATVTADVGSLDTGQTSVPMTAGAYSVAGVSYNYRSASLGADNPLSAGSKAFTVTATDNASNSSSLNGSLTVDNTAPTASDVQATNGGSNAGQLEQGDTITFTYSEPIDPESILTDWNGSQTDVVVRINNNAIPILGFDQLQVHNSSNTTALALGSVNLGGDYVLTDRTFGATGTKSRMTRSGSSITVVLGTASGVSVSPLLTTTMSWASSTSAYDRAGNAATGNTATESGAADKEF